MNKLMKSLVFLVILAALTTGCSNNNKDNQGSGDPSKPKPQVRVEAMPSATQVSTPVVTPTLMAEPTSVATSAPVYYDPTPDVDQLADQIDAMLTDIERKLNGEKFILK